MAKSAARVLRAPKDKVEPSAEPKPGWKTKQLLRMIDRVCRRIGVKKVSLELQVTNGKFVWFAKAQRNTQSSSVHGDGYTPREALNTLIELWEL